MDHLLQSERGNPSETEIGETDHLLQSEKGNPSEIEIGQMDWISHLPEFIIHRILSLLIPWHAPPTEFVRMSVLSKNWFDLIASFPVLDFNIRNFRCRESFFKYVEYTTSRFCHQNVTAAQRFKLITTLLEPADLDVINQCLGLLLKNGVRVLDIDITNSSESPMPKYRLPNILLSVSVLKYLKIRGCELPSSLMVDVIKFKSLIQLSLENVPIDDEVIKHLTTSCPLLEALFIRSCHGFKIFSVNRHHYLQKLFVDCDTQVERIDVEAPNLSNLTVAEIDERRALPMNLTSCKKLTTVTYFLHPFSNSNGFTNFSSNFPFIENLFLITHNKRDLKLSSHSLRAFVLQSDCDLEEIEFTTPNLVIFIYACNPRLFWPNIMDMLRPWLRDSTRLKACMHCYPDSYIDPLWFQKLRQFLDKKNGFKVLNLYIHIMYIPNMTKLKKLKAIKLPPYQLEHVELQLNTCKESSAHIAFVDVVLQCFRPRSLTLRSVFYITDLEEQYDVVKFTYKKLLEQEDEGHTKIHMVGPFSSKAQKHLRDMKTMSMALACEGKAISFIKEEVVQEEVG